MAELTASRHPFEKIARGLRNSIVPVVEAQLRASVCPSFHVVAHVSIPFLFHGFPLQKLVANGPWNLRENLGELLNDWTSSHHGLCHQHIAGCGVRPHGDGHTVFHMFSMFSIKNC